MDVSVVLCTYSPDLYEDCCEAAESILSQTHDGVELVLIVDGTEEVYERVRDDFGDRPDVVLHCNDENRGLLESRNRGAELASGDIVAFIDDDAVADERWLESLVAAYEEENAIAAGGTMTPLWVAGKPDFLPAEFYWLVGVTHRGFADGSGEVRNTFGSNISFRRDVFLELGGFDTDIGGRKGDSNLQGGETELCARMQRAYGRGVWYVPEAEVGHKVFEYRTDFRWLLERAFWQGYSKRAMEVLVPDSSDEEGDFLGQLLFDSVPARVRATVDGETRRQGRQLLTLCLLTVTVGFGYLYGLTRWR
ncbi:glucosyl-dolichyl phosphate glucuronosyltransferase [Halomontanus rarus]|uniref:glucosyl-dolichyl phosphate glucuronosyltransferase n=1 Tax=Halomontanus rarus TaxID=3034020 RepID=UPI0023E89AD4|nr:glucosyl-dolichyl phosphate glucuronosyltransferase [Halovivax sp. TS33]